MYKDTFDVPERPAEGEDFGFWGIFINENNFSNVAPDSGTIWLAVLGTACGFIAVFTLLAMIAERKRSNTKMNVAAISTVVACIVGAPMAFMAASNAHEEKVASIPAEERMSYEDKMAIYVDAVDQHRIDNKEDLTYNLKLKYNIDDVMYEHPDYYVYSAEPGPQDIIVIVDSAQILFTLTQDTETFEPTLLDPLVEAGSLVETNVPTAHSLLKDG